MSHFSVCVIVPDDGVVNNIHANNLEDHLIPVLAPFDEQTEEEKYREFEDRTEEAKADFENDTMRVVRFPDGSIHSIYDDAFNKSFFIEEDRIYAFGPNRDRKSKLQTEESKALELVTDYPVKSWYPSFEAYCNEHRGFVKVSDGRWGYTCNPNAKWDWWQIGGRFPNRFLVPEGLQDCIPSAKGDDGESAIPPEGVSVCRCRTQEGYLLGCHAQDRCRYGRETVSEVCKSIRGQRPYRFRPSVQYP